jgi:hypothetical protein
MTKENLVLDGHALANETVAGNLAAFADDGTALDFDKSADAAVGPDMTVVKINKIRLVNDHSITHRHARQHRFLLRTSTVRHTFRVASLQMSGEYFARSRVRIARES